MYGTGHCIQPFGAEGGSPAGDGLAGDADEFDHLGLCEADLAAVQKARAESSENFVGQLAGVRYGVATTFLPFPPLQPPAPTRPLLDSVSPLLAEVKMPNTPWRHGTHPLALSHVTAADRLTK